ncbi:MAG: hypothetical protein ABJD57_01235, partial [Roseibium sp.]
VVFGGQDLFFCASAPFYLDVSVGVFSYVGCQIKNPARGRVFLLVAGVRNYQDLRPAEHVLLVLATNLSAWRNAS